MLAKTKIIDFLKVMGSPAALFLISYPLLDVLVPFVPTMGLVGFGWILSVFILLCCVALVSLKELVSIAREERSWCTLVTIVGWVCFLIVAAIPERLLSDESIFEFGCPQVVFREREDFGFIEQCFIGYPNRSFLLQALPVALFGFSPFVANLAASAYLFPGLILFAHGLRIVTARARMSDLISALALLMLFQSTLFIRIIFYHDQTSAPIALTLSFVGLAVLSVWRESRLALFTLLALILVSTAMYPPVLAALGLLAIFFLWAIATKRLPRGSTELVGITAILAVVAFCQTLVYRLDLRLGVDRYNQDNFSSRLKELLTFIISQQNGQLYAEPVLHLLFLGCLGLGLFGVFGRYVFVFSTWATALIFISFFTSGMSPELAWWEMVGIHRAAPAFAVFALILAVGLSKRLKHHHLSQAAQIVLVAVVMLPAIRGVSREPIKPASPLAYRIWQLAQRETPPGVIPNPTLITRNDIAVLGEIPKHYLYLNLDRTFTYYAGTCLPKDPVPPHTLVVTIDDAICQQNQSHEGFQEVAAWREKVLESWSAGSATIRIYKAISTP